MPEIDGGKIFCQKSLTHAFLHAQLEEADTITAKRKQIFQTYYKGLCSLADSGRIRLPHTPSNIDGNAHMFYCILGSHAERTKLIDFLNSKRTRLEKNDERFRVRI